MSKQSRKPKTFWKVIDSDGRVFDAATSRDEAEGILSLLKAIQVDSRNKSCWEVIDIGYRTFSSG